MKPYERSRLLLSRFPYVLYTSPSYTKAYFSRNPVESAQKHRISPHTQKNSLLTCCNYVNKLSHRSRGPAPCLIALTFSTSCVVTILKNSSLNSRCALLSLTWFKISAIGTIAGLASTSSLSVKLYAMTKPAKRLYKLRVWVFGL